MPHQPTSRPWLTSFHATNHATPAARAVSVCLRADAAGAGAVILTTAPVTRNAASASAQLRAAWFHLPIVSAVEVNEVVGTLRERRVTILAADGAGPTDLDEAADTGLLAAPYCLVDRQRGPRAARGRRGVIRSGRPRADLRAESLNLATAAAVCLYAPAGAHRRTP